MCLLSASSTKESFCVGLFLQKILFFACPFLIWCWFCWFGLRPETGSFPAGCGRHCCVFSLSRITPTAMSSSPWASHMNFLSDYVPATTRKDHQYSLWDHPGLWVPVNCVPKAHVFESFPPPKTGDSSLEGCGSWGEAESHWRTQALENGPWAL